MHKVCIIAMNIISATLSAVAGNEEKAAFDSAAAANGKLAWPEGLNFESTGLHLPDSMFTALLDQVAQAEDLLDETERAIDESEDELDSDNEESAPKRLRSQSTTVKKQTEIHKEIVEELYHKHPSVSAVGMVDLANAAISKLGVSSLGPVGYSAVKCYLRSLRGTTRHISGERRVYDIIRDTLKENRSIPYHQLEAKILHQ
jgi:hypothetical protein